MKKVCAVKILRNSIYLQNLYFLIEILVNQETNNNCEYQLSCCNSGHDVIYFRVTDIEDSESNWSPTKEVNNKIPRQMTYSLSVHMISPEETFRISQ